MPLWQALLMFHGCVHIVMYLCAHVTLYILVVVVGLLGCGLQSVSSVAMVCGAVVHLMQRSACIAFWSWVGVGLTLRWGVLQVCVVMLFDGDCACVCGSAFQRFSEPGLVSRTHCTPMLGDELRSCRPAWSNNGFCGISGSLTCLALLAGDSAHSTDATEKGWEQEVVSCSVSGDVHKNKRSQHHAISAMESASALGQQKPAFALAFRHPILHCVRSCMLVECGFRSMGAGWGVL